MPICEFPRVRSLASLAAFNRRNLLKTAAGAALLAALPGSLVAQQETPKKGGVLKIAAPFNPSSLDPLTGGAGSDHMILYPLFDTLVDFEPGTLAPKPGLATSWEFTDPKTLVLNLREGVRFHDGEPFDAAAVKAHLERAKSDPRSSVKGDIASLDSVEVLAPNKVALKLSRPDTALPLILADRAGMVSSPKAAAKGRQYDREPVGTGPFKFEKWNDNDVVILVRNPDYWNKDLPHLDGLTFRIITDLNTGLLGHCRREPFRLPAQSAAEGGGRPGRRREDHGQHIADHCRLPPRLQLQARAAERRAGAQGDQLRD